MDLLKINQVFQNYYFDADANDNPEIINCGWCYQWAWVAHRLFGGELCSVMFNLKKNNLVSFDKNEIEAMHHAFVKINNLYYDATVLEGTDNWKTLPSFYHLNLNSLKLFTDDSEEEFWERWSKYGATPDYQMWELFKK